MSRQLRLCLLAFALALLIGAGNLSACQLETAPPPVVPNPDALALVVMDPLAGPLACDCVQGYAQRKYELLGTHLERKLGQPVQVWFGETLAAAMEESGGRADLIIGKHSVVLAHASTAQIEVAPLARLTGKDDSVTQTGLIVVRAENPAQSISDLDGYRIFFGPADCDEKHAAPMELLREHGIAANSDGGETEICSACSVAAKQLVELSANDKAAAVISSYAAPLLEGCGNIKKGDLRIVAESKPVPFITAFVNHTVATEARERIASALADVELDAELLSGLETGSGFLPWVDEPITETVTGDQPGDDGKKKSP
jgi:ABC-type phosphate/phosphonate transport system substrate-binding protein